MFSGTFPVNRRPEGYRQLTVSTTAVGLGDATGGIPQASTYVEIIVSDAGVRYRDDGVAATASAGMPVASGETIVLHSSKQMDDFSVIRDGGSDAELNISYYSAAKAY